MGGRRTSDGVGQRRLARRVRAAIQLTLESIGHAPPSYEDRPNEESNCGAEILPGKFFCHARCALIPDSAVKQKGGPCRKEQANNDRSSGGISGESITCRDQDRARRDGAKGRPR